MANSKPMIEPELNKFQRYRNNKQAKGMRLLRVWVPDLKRPEFVKEAKRQGLFLKTRVEEKEALDFIETQADWSGQ